MKSIFEYVLVGAAVILIGIVFVTMFLFDNNKHSEFILGAKVEINDPFFINCNKGIVLNQHKQAKTYKVLLLCNPQEVFISNTYEIPEENLSVIH